MMHKIFSKLCIVSVTIILLISLVCWYFLSKRTVIRNVILISLDTCRADHLGCYGFERNTSPNIDALAADGIVFENAFTPIPLTLPAHSSMLTGTYPLYHKVHDNINYQLDESNITIAEILSEKGYSTGAIISSYVLYPQFGIDQGFDSYNYTFVNPIMAGTNKDTERRGGEASEFACQYLEEHKEEPFFLFLHYYDPHTKYDPPEPYASEYADDLYSGEIAYTDHCLGQVIEKLKALDLYDSTLIIVVGDHGEALGEHGEVEHGYFIYQCTTRVPFIIHPPGLKGGRKVRDVTSLVDVVPTILSYLKIDIPDYIQGKDLSGYAHKKNNSEIDRQIYAESLEATKYGGNPLLGLINSRFQYIETIRPELYALLSDCGAAVNLIDKEPRRARLMKGQLQELLIDLATGKTGDGKIELDEESRKKLESLGYVGGDNVNESFELDQTKKDPKDLIEYYSYAHEVTYLKYYQKYSEAITLSKEMLQKWPDIHSTYFMLTRLCSLDHRYQDVIKYGTIYLSSKADIAKLDVDPSGLSPTKPIAKTHDLIAAAAFELEKYDSAIGHWGKALELKADWPEAHNNIAGAFYTVGNTGKAIEHWRIALRLVPGWENVKDNLNVLLQRKELEDRIADLEEKVKVNPDDAEAHNELGKIFYRSGEFDKVVLHWGAVVRIDPDDVTVRNNLAWVLAASKDDTVLDAQRAVELAQNACELTDYKQPGMLDTLGVAYAAAGRFDEAIAAAEKAVEVAFAEGQIDMADDIGKRLKLYKNNKAYRD